MRGCELRSRQRHVLAHIAGAEYEALLELHILLLLMLLLHILVVLLLLSRMSLLHLLLLLFLSLLFLLCGSMSLRHLFRCWLLRPTPFFFELLVNKTDAPTGLLVNFLKDSNDLFLLGSVRDDFACMCKRAYCYRCDATANRVSILLRPTQDVVAYRSFT